MSSSETMADDTNLPDQNNIKNNYHHGVEDDDLVKLKAFPEKKCNIVSRVCFTWMNPVLRVARKKQVEDGDCFLVPDTEGSAVCTRDFERVWEEKNTSDPKGTYTLHRAIATYKRRTLWISAVLETVSIVCAVAVPKIFHHFLDLLETDNYKLWHALLFCVALYVMELLRACTGNFNYWVLFRSEVGIRAGLMGAMYNKSLVLAGSSREKFSLGKAVSLMSSDIMRLDTAWYYVHFFWTSPLVFILSLGLLATIIHKAVWVSIAIIGIFFPLQVIMVYMVYRYRTRANEISDRRLKLLQEVISGIRVIKYHAWEDVFQQRIQVLRNEELRYIRRMKLVGSMVSTLTISFPALLTAVTLSAYSYFYGNLTSQTAFASTAYFDILEVVLAVLPSAMTYATEAASSLQRIQSFLRAPVHLATPHIDVGQESAVRISEGVFEWDKLSTDSTDSPKKKPASLPVIAAAAAVEDDEEGLRKRTLSVPKAGVYDMDDGLWRSSSPVLFSQVHIPFLEIARGELVAVVGPVGSGKSSLLNVIMGELIHVGGKVSLGGHIGLCPQQAWILNATIRDNILFGSPYDAEKYQRVVFECALEADIGGFPEGDLTLIGENGISLSGGQKQRISIARMVYFDPELALLDDPLSAVDAHVANHIMKECILASTCTRILVTHNLALLDQVDRILVMSNGRIAQQGSLAEILASDTPFAILLSQYFTHIQEDVEVEGEPQDFSETSSTSDVPPRSPSVLSPLPLPRCSSAGNSEELATDAVSIEAYFRYFAACGGITFLIVAALTGVLGEGGRSFSDIWMTWWSENEHLDGSVQRSNAFYVKGMLLLGSLQAVMSWVNCIVFVVGGYFASRVMHVRALKRVLSSPMSFFDGTPVGRIINRFGKDTDVVDSNLPDELNNLFFTFCVIFSPVIVVSVTKAVLVVPIVFPIIIGYYLQQLYRDISKQFQRLNILAFSPFLSNFSESYAGLLSVRAFQAQSMFTQRHHTANDNVHRSLIMFGALRRWISIRSEVIGSTLMFIIGVSCSIGRFASAITGLALTQALKITKALDWCIKQLAETEISVVCSIRLDDYGSRLLTEAPAVIEDCRPPEEWPSQGVVEFQNLTVRYRADLPPVLNNLSFSCRPRERLAIVGRTGAGKSTVLNVLFRMIEPSAGQILVDGVDICSLGLADLRSRLAIVPQDPILFSGTLRFNLDPLNQHDDAEIWQALERVHLKDLVAHSPGQLEMHVEECGSNFSIGQRQMFCLSRALLRRTCVLLMDEATANIDHQTDALVQESLREHFKGHTIITIAHRINTIIDYDRVLVLRNGSIVEFDSPKNLLADPDSLFFKMAAQHNSSSSNNMQSTSK